MSADETIREIVREELEKMQKDEPEEPEEETVEKDESKGRTLSGLIDAGLETSSDMQKSRKDLVQMIADRADVEPATVENMARGEVDCPDQRVVETAASVLNLDKSTLLLAGRADGCDYSLGMSKSGQELHGEADDEFQSTFEIAKTDEERQLVGGIIFKADRPDLEGDIPSSPVVVENALHDFMLKSQQAGIAHMVASDDIKFVELWTAKTDFDWNGTEVRKGDALGVAKIFDKELWTITKDEELFNGFSVEGKAVRPVSEDGGDSE